MYRYFWYLLGYNMYDDDMVIDSPLFDEEEKKDIEIIKKTSDKYIMINKYSLVVQELKGKIKHLYVD